MGGSDRHSSFPVGVTRLRAGACRSRTVVTAQRPDAMGDRRADPMRPPPLVRRSDGVHRATAIPWARARATRRRQVSWLTGQRPMHGLPRHHAGSAFRPVAVFRDAPKDDVHRARRLQLQGQLWIWAKPPAPHSHFKPLSGHRRDHRPHFEETNRGRGATTAHDAALQDAGSINVDRETGRSSIRAD
jgi:hypothetical protein